MYFTVSLQQDVEASLQQGGVSTSLNIVVSLLHPCYKILIRNYSLCNGKLAARINLPGANQKLPCFTAEN